MKKDGNIISKYEYDEIEKDIIPMPLDKAIKLKKTEYDLLGREINNPEPIFLNDPENLDKPLTLNGKILRILRDKQMSHLEKQIETPEEMNDFGPEEIDPINETEYQIVDLEDPTKPDSEPVDPDPADPDPADPDPADSDPADPKPSE